jgi:Protein of unknown function (DUF2934)
MKSDSGPPEDYVDITHTCRQQWIAETAYYKAETRGFEPGFETVDWLAAEQDYVEMLIKNFLAVCKDDGDMSMAGLRQLAKVLGVAGADCIFSKTELIRLIQTASYQRPCFRAQPSESCQEKSTCQWSSECHKLLAEWRR